MRHLLLFISALFVITMQAQTKYSLENKGGKYVCTGESDYTKETKNMFGGVVLWALEQTPADSKQKMPILSCDVKTYTMTARPLIQIGDYNYSVYLTIQLNNGKLQFLIDRIRCTPKNSIGGLGGVNLDKINLAKRPQQQEHIDRFKAMCDGYVKKMLAEIQSKDMDLSHWDAISKGQVVKGMTEDECKLAVGNPMNVVENAQRVQWTYAGGLIVVFEDGKISGIVR